MKKTLFAAGAGLILLLGACSKDPDKTDFKKQTADFINKDNGDVEINGKNSFIVNSAAPAGGATTGDTTAAEVTTATT